MKQLLLMRHAHTEPFRTGEDDHSRQLTPQGIKECDNASSTIKSIGFKPDTVLVSSAKRTRQTAKQLEFNNTITANTITYIDKLYLASPGELLYTINNVPETSECVLIISHNPGLYELVFHLTNYQHSVAISSFPTCGLAHLYWSDKTWREITPNSAILKAMYAPEQQLV